MTGRYTHRIVMYHVYGVTLAVVYSRGPTPILPLILGRKLPNIRDYRTVTLATDCPVP